MLISARHQRLYEQYYAGCVIECRPNQWLHVATELANEMLARSVIDYGCGAARSFAGFTPIKVVSYDPGVPEFAAKPEPSDVVVCIHTLEHIEPESVDEVIEDLVSLTLKALLIVVSCQRSTKTLPDGSPWHSFVRDGGWWREKLRSFGPFTDVKTLKKLGMEYAAVMKC